MALPPFLGPNFGLGKHWIRSMKVGKVGGVGESSLLWVSSAWFLASLVRTSFE